MTQYITLTKLCEDNVILTNKFNGYIYTLDKENDRIMLRSDDDCIEVYHESYEALIIADNICSIDEVKYYMHTKQKYIPQ